MAQYGSLSPDGTRLALAGDGNIVRVYNVPELDLQGTIPLRKPFSSDLSIRSMAFHPSGKFLFVANESAFPAKIDLGKMAHVREYDGHSEDVRQVAFRGESTILTYGRDRTVCAWNGDTLAFEGRVDIPRGTELAAMGGLRFGRVLAVEEGYDEDEWPDGREAVVLEVPGGREVARFDLPAGSDTRSALWWSEARLLLFGSKGDWVRTVDPAGRGAPAGFDCPGARLYSGALSEDGATLYRPESLFKSTRRFEIHTFDFRSGVQVTRKIPGMTEVHGQWFGLVPGGRFLCFADRGIFVLDRADLAVVGARRLPGCDIDDIDFAGDGGSYVVATPYRDLPAELRSRCPAGTNSVVVVQDTETGRTRLALPTTTHGPPVALNANGTRLVYVESDGRPVLVDF
jgi:WD40 repeat protein